MRDQPVVRHPGETPPPLLPVSYFPYVTADIRFLKSGKDRISNSSSWTASAHFFVMAEVKG
jgi:hypothetical protein